MKPKEPPSPKFDLEASNFPPLPGSVVTIQGETTPEMRLSDVVRGLKVTNKVDILTSSVLCPLAGKHTHILILNLHLFQPACKEVNKIDQPNASEGAVGKPDAGPLVAKPASTTSPTTG